ncbi:MAG: sulfurtransferase TusA family protein, partial [Planctomycetota bacterium]
KHGNRKNKQRARLRYLVEEKGFDAFRALYRDELARLRKESPAAPTLRPITPRLEGQRVDGVPPADGFGSWRRSNVTEQKQPGYYLVHVPVFLGELTAETMEQLAEIAERFGEGTIRTTPSQNLVFRWISEAELASLHRELSKLGLAASVPPVLREMIACTGANTCRLGICLSQGLAAASREALENAGLDLDEAVSLRLHINGCPNSCGRHAVASIGLVGAARRLNDRLTPHYRVQLGGSVGEGRTRLATGKEMIPARHLPAFLVELLRHFRGSQQYPDFDAYLESGGREEATRISDGYKQIPTFEEDEKFYYDWGAAEPFSLAGRGPGECSAGVFDLIRVDITSAQQAFEENRLLAATTLAARAMLITQGEEAKDGLESLRLFEKHFLDPGHIDASFRNLIIRAREALASPDGCHAFRAEASEVAALIAAVENLYENMDQSLRFHKTPADGGMVVPEEPKETNGVRLEDVRIDREADFREVTCPLNYVKTKLLLGQMKKGQVLSVLLDEAGGKSVPRSAEKDGHQILAEQREGDRWRVVIRKG